MTDQHGSHEGPVSIANVHSLKATKASHQKSQILSTTTAESRKLKSKPTGLKLDLKRCFNALDLTTLLYAGSTREIYLVRGQTPPTRNFKKQVSYHITNRMDIRGAASRRLKKTGFCQKGAASQKVEKRSPSDISFAPLFQGRKSYE